MITPPSSGFPASAKKTAERVVLELKDKLDNLASTPEPASPGSAFSGPIAEDVLSALLNLGYPRPVAQKALETAISRDPALATRFEPLFRLALTCIK